MAADCIAISTILRPVSVSARKQKRVFSKIPETSRLNSQNSKTEAVRWFDDVNELDRCALVNHINDDYLSRSYNHVRILAVIMRRNCETVLLWLPSLPVVSPKRHLPRLRSDQSQAVLTRHGRSRSQWQPFTILAGLLQSAQPAVRGCIGNVPWVSQTIN